MEATDANTNGSCSGFGDVDCRSFFPNGAAPEWYDAESRNEDENSQASH